MLPVRARRTARPGPRACSINHWSAGVPACRRGTMIRPQKSPPAAPTAESACTVTSSSTACPASATARSPSAPSRRSACAHSMSCWHGARESDRETIGSSKDRALLD